MIKNWIKHLLWQPFEIFCRNFPLIPFNTKTTHFDGNVRQIKIYNFVTKLISKLGGGYDYSVLYLVDDILLIDTGFSWARRNLKKYLLQNRIPGSLRVVVCTHAHEDHIGNNILIEELTEAVIYAHPLAITTIKHPKELKWYRNFMFGSSLASNVKEIPPIINIRNYRFEVIYTPGHSLDHICLFERNRRWLFSGDLYIAPDMDSQLNEVDGNMWIRSLEKIIDLKAEWMFDAHGKVYQGEQEVRRHLTLKISFLKALRDRIFLVAKEPVSIEEITKKVFNQNTLLDHLSFGDGWLSLLTSSDFARSNLVHSFLKNRNFDNIK